MCLLSDSNVRGCQARAEYAISYAARLHYCTTALRVCFIAVHGLQKG